MSITEAVASVLGKYATFSGRAPRSEYWWWVLAVFLALTVAGIIDGAVIAPALGFPAFAMEAGQPLSALVSLAVFLPGLAVAVRRLHDTGRSGWWLLIVLVPLIGGLVLLWFLVQPSQPGDNRFGRNPPG